jgi:hypothetical protein
MKAGQTQSKVPLSEETRQVLLMLGEHQVAFDTASGELLRFGDRDLIVRGPFLSAWRAPTDNDMLQLLFGATHRAVAL